MYFFKQSPLLSILFLAAAIRVVFVFMSETIFFPDEIFQTLEPAFRAIHGYGLIPWEFRHGLRSYIPASFAMIPLGIAQILHIDNVSSYVLITRLFFAGLSLVVPLTLYRIAQDTFSSSRLASIVAVISVFWYELVYLAPRLGSEILASYGILTAWALLGAKPIRSNIFGAFFILTLAIYLRPQYGFSFIFLMVLLYQRTRLSFVKAVGLASGLGLILAGWVDKLTWGHWFYSFYQNIQLSFLGKISEVFGVSPWYQYIQDLAITSFGVFFFALFTPRKYRTLGWLVFGILSLHSLIPHKEYRFIILIIPILIMLSVGALEQVLAGFVTSKRQRSMVVIGLFLVVSALGYSSILPKQDQVYHTQVVSQSGQLQAYKFLSNQTDVCGIVDMSVQWELSGGYYYLGQQVPFYSVNHPPREEAYVNYLLTEDQGELVGNFVLVKQWQDLSLYRRLGKCQVDPNFDYHRYTDMVEERLSVLEKG